MEWGTFTSTHIISIVLGLYFIICLDIKIKKLNKKNKIISLFILSLSGLTAIIYNLIHWDNPIEYLPLHLCSLNAIILPIVILTKSKIAGNMLLLWSLGALVALVINNDIANTKVWGITFTFYYLPHLLEFGIPIILFKHRIIIKNKKYILSTCFITLIVYTLIHYINLSINNYCIANNITNTQGDYVKVNYMFSIFPQNPVLLLLYKIIPFSYWYMFLLIPIIVLYLILIYKKEIFKKNALELTSVLYDDIIRI